eukprot:5971608-Amphidinium_carterae.1
MHPLVGCQDVVHFALIRDTLSAMDLGDARGNEYSYEPPNRTMHVAAQYYPEPIHLEILESAIRSFADEYINHPAGIEGNDSTDWCSFPLQ